MRAFPADKGNQRETLWEKKAGTPETVAVSGVPMPFVDKKDATEKSYGNNDVPNLNLVAVQLSEEMDSN